MRLLFFFFAATLVTAWYAWAIRPVKREQSNVLFVISGVALLLLILGVLRLV